MCFSGVVASASAMSVYAGTPSGPVGSVDYSPLSIASVPTLGGSLLIILALLMALIAFHKFRQHVTQGMPMAVAILAGGALVMAGGGVKIISGAQAAPSYVSVDMNDPNGGSLLLVANNLPSQGDIEWSEQFRLTNQSNVTLRITAIESTAPGISCGNPPFPTTEACAVGQPLESSDFCNVVCFISMQIPQ